MKAVDPKWARASVVLRSAAKLVGWKVTYYGKDHQKGQRGWMILEPPPGTHARANSEMTMGYRRGDDFMRRGPYYRLLVAYDQQERMPLL